MQRIPLQVEKIQQSSDDLFVMQGSSPCLDHAVQMDARVHQETLDDGSLYSGPNPRREENFIAPKADNSDESSPGTSFLISSPPKAKTQASLMEGGTAIHSSKNEEYRTGAPRPEPEEQTTGLDEQTLPTEKDSSNFNILLNNLLQSLNTDAAASDNSLRLTATTTPAKNKRPHPRRLRTIHSSPSFRPLPASISTDNTNKTANVRPHRSKTLRNACSQPMAQAWSDPRRRCQSFAANRTKSRFPTQILQLRSMTQVFPLTQIPTPALDTASLSC